MDLRQLTGFVPIGGWNDMILSADVRFPGWHWNQPFACERVDGAGAGSIRMECATGGLHVTRTITVAENQPAVAVTTEYRNVSEEAFTGMHIRTQPIVTPGGRRTPDTAVLWPGTNRVDVLTLSDSIRGAGRFASFERKAEANWWACSDAGAEATVLVEDVEARTVSQNLFQDANLLILENIGVTDDLRPGDVRRMAIAIHHYPFDLRPWVGRFGSSRFLPARNLLVGIKLRDTEVSPGERSLTVELTCIRLAEEHPGREGILRLSDAAGGILWERRVGLDPAAHARAAGATLAVDVGDLSLGEYTLAFALAGSSRASIGEGTLGSESPAVSVTLCVVEQTQRQKQELERRELDGLLRQCEAAVAACSAGSFAGAMLRKDLAAARAFVCGNALDLARQYVRFVMEALHKVAADSPVAHPDPRDLKMPDEWFHAVEGSIPVMPMLSRHPDHYGTFHDKQLTNGWHYRDDAQAAYALAWLYFHPSSRYHGQNEAICQAVHAVDALCRSFGEGTLPRDIATDGNINRFTLCPLGEALRILLHLPVAPARKAYWREQYGKAADHQIRTYGGRSIPEGGYLNQDVMYLLVMRFAHAVSGDVRYLDQCQYSLDMIESQLLPDGAFYYIYPHNEVTIYHEINITYLFRDWMLSGEARSRRLIENSARYYPLMVGADGRVEFSSQTWWKHTGGRWPLLGAAVVAGVTGDGRNQYIASQAVKAPVDLGAFDRLMYAGLAARGDVKPEPLADREVTLDRNVRGPRGRFGPWSWVGTAAPYRDTLVGCMLTDVAQDRAYAMHYAGAQVVFGGEDEVNPYLGGVGLAMSPADYAGDSLIRNERAVLGARYGLFQYEHELAKDRESDWCCEQLWYFDDERLIGLMRLEAIRETKARAVDLSVRFANYDAVWQKAGTEFEQIGDGIYAAGPLVLRVVEHNLESNVVQDAWVCAYTRDRPGKGFYARSASRDGRFAKGSEFSLLVEVRPRMNAPARITRLDDAFGFRVGTGGDAFTVRLSGPDQRFQCELDERGNRGDLV